MTYRERRQRGGWTLEQIAALAEVNVSTLNRIELDKAKPNRATQRAIDAALASMESETATQGGTK